MRKVYFPLLILAAANVVWGGSLDPVFGKILDQYFQIHAALVQDSTKGVDAAARKIIDLVATVETSDAQTDKLLTQIKNAAGGILGKNLEQTRQQFFELTQPLLVYLNQSYSGKAAFHRYYCSMQNKAWIQKDKGARNPYYGSSMPTCGKLIK